MKRDELFEVLDPPPGGLTRLRSRLAARSTRRRAVLSLGSALAAACLVVLWVAPRETPGLVMAAQALVATSREAVEARGTTAVEAMPSSNPSVVLYRVSAVEGPPEP